jgi:hypothetical protein
MRDLVNVDIGARCDGGTSNAAFSQRAPPYSRASFYPLLKDRGLVGAPSPSPHRACRHTLDAETGPRGTVLCWCCLSLAQDYYVIRYVCLKRVRWGVLCYGESLCGGRSQKSKKVIHHFCHMSGGRGGWVGESDDGSAF